MRHPPTLRRQKATAARCALQATASRPRLETLPYDILELIFRLVCIDGGRAGCTLALVSKSIRLASRSSRFHSVSLLCGIRTQLKRFVHALDCAKAEARGEGAPIPHVRHLCMMLTPVFERQDLEHTDLDRAQKDHQRTLRRLYPDVLEAMQKEIRERYGTVVRSFFCSESAYFETACLFSQYHYADPQMPPGIPSFAWNCRNAPFFPALRRLHIAQCYSIAAVDFREWATQAPRLTWLRLAPILPFPQSTFDLLSNLALALTQPGSATHAGSQHMTTPTPAFTELKTLMVMVIPFYLIEIAPQTYIAEVHAMLDALGIPTTFFHPKYKAEDAAAPGSLEPITEFENGVRRDWLFRLEGGEGLFTLEFWRRQERVPGRLKRLWTALRARFAPMRF